MKRLVIFGAGIACLDVMRHLKKNGLDAEVVIVDPKDYVEIPYAALRALVDPEFGKKIRRKISDLYECRHIQAKLVELKTNCGILDNGEQLYFDFAVLATGSQVRGFYNLKVNSRRNIKEREIEWESEAEKIFKAKDVAVVGGGPIGVELAAEIAETFPDKNITLIHSGNRLLEALPPAAGVKASKILKLLNVNVIFNELAEINEGDSGKMIVLNSGRKLNTDIVYMSIGNENNIEYVRENFPLHVNDQKQIIVDDYLRMNNVMNIWAVGDVNNVPEIKLGALIDFQAANAVKNIIAELSGKKMKKYKPLKGALGFVTLGRQYGIAQLPFGRFDLLIKLKQKDLFVSKQFK